MTNDVTVGSSSPTVYLQVLKDDGTGNTAIVYNTSGLAAYYIRPGGARTSISLATQTAGGAYSSGGFVHIGGGVCRLDLPTAAVASGVNCVVVEIDDATDIRALPCIVRLVPANASALSINSSGHVTLADSSLVTAKLGTFQLASNALANVTAWTVNLTGSLSGSVGSISGVTFPSNFALLAIDSTGGVTVLDSLVRRAVGLDEANLDVWLGAIVANTRKSGIG